MNLGSRPQRPVGALVSFFSGMSLRGKLLLCFVLTTLLPVLFIGIETFQRFKKTLQENRIEDLKTIADLKVTKIETFFQERKNNLKTIQNDPNIQANFQTLIRFSSDQEGLEYHTARLRLDSLLRVVETTYGYIDVMLVNTEGIIIYVSNPEHAQADLGSRLPDPGDKVFELGQREIYISKPFVDDREKGIPAMLMSAPLQNFSGERLGLIVFEMSMAPIYDFIQDRSGLGESGETLIGRKEGDSAVFINPIRHDKTTILQRKVKLGSDHAFPIQKAVQGESGEGISLDYRPKEIIAAWRYIPLLDWGMVAKINTEEAFEAIASEKNRLILFGFLTLFFGVGIFVLIARSITAPIDAIQLGMSKVQAGQMDLLPVKDGRGEVAPLIHLFNEMITQLEKRSKDLSDFRYALNTAAVVAVTDEKGKILFANDKFCEISRFRREELIGQDHRIISSGHHSKSFIKGMWATIAGGKIWRGTLKNKAKDGTPYWVDTSIVPFLNEEGKPYQYLAIRFDITPQKKFEEKVFHLAHYDDLTGLPNRASFKESLLKVVSIRRLDNLPFALMFLDLDEFKLVNDTLGHSSGDQLLQEVAKRLRESLREEDIVARLGGDEFTLLLPSIAKQEDVYIIARKIIESLKKPVEIGEEELFVTASIGIALFPDHGKTPDELMKNADTAMYQAKKSGRARFTFYSSATRQFGEKTLSLISALSHAIDREELVLYYQPIVDLKQGALFGMEALIRWNREGVGMISPADFIPLAEKSGLILPIGDWILETAMAQYQCWQEAGFRNLSLSINVAAPQFQEDTFVEKIAEAMARHGIGANQINLELTESILMKNQDEIVTKLEQLESLGLHLSIDDFGTGFSSLSYLKRFPIHCLKIDQSFVRGLPDDREDAAITNTVITLAKQLKLNLVAEGIETKEQLAYLQAQGCDLGQGYFFSRPLPVEKFTELLESGDTGIIFTNQAAKYSAS